VSTPAIPIRGTRAPRANILLLAALLGSLALAAGVAVWLLASGSSSGAVERQGPSAAAIGAFEEATGVQLVRVALTGGGGIVDLRFRVLDPDKAVAVHGPKSPPAIVDESTGKVVDEPFMGHRMAPRKMRAGATQYVLLVNTQGLVESGEHVTVRLAGVGLKDVLVW